MINTDYIFILEKKFKLIIFLKKKLNHNNRKCIFFLNSDLIIFFILNFLKTEIKRV
jgi:hypothetical protein